MNIKPIIGNRFVRNTLLGAAMMGAATTAVMTTGVNANAADRRTLSAIGVETAYTDAEINNAIATVPVRDNITNRTIATRNKDLERAYIIAALHYDTKGQRSDKYTPEREMSDFVADYFYGEHGLYGATLHMQYLVDLFGMQNMIPKYTEKLKDYYQNDPENAIYDYSLVLSGVDAKEYRNQQVEQALNTCNKYDKEVLHQLYDQQAQIMRPGQGESVYTYQQASQKLNESFTSLMPSKKKEYQEYLRKSAAYARKFGTKPTALQKSKILAYKTHLLNMELVRASAKGYGVANLPKFEEFFMTELDKATRP